MPSVSKRMVTFLLSNYLGTANEENYQINLDLIQITDSIEFWAVP